MILRDEDLEIVTGCEAKHPDTRGGQHVAKQCTGVRITHKPTGVSVLADDGRSQIRNRVSAMCQLRALLDPEEV